MRCPDVGSSAERLVNVYGLYHVSRLRADADAAGLAEAFSQAQDALKKKMEDAQDAEVAAMTAMTVPDAKDDELDDAVRALYFKLLQKVLNKREDPLFLRYFPDGMSAIIGPPPEEEVRSVRILLAKLGRRPTRTSGHTRDRSRGLSMLSLPRSRLMRWPSTRTD